MAPEVTPEADREPIKLINLVPRSLGYEINFCLESVQKVELRTFFIYSYSLL